MKNKNKSNGICIYVNDSTQEELIYLMRILSMTKTALIEKMVKELAQSVKSSPELLTPETIKRIVEGVNNHE